MDMVSETMFGPNVKNQHNQPIQPFACMHVL